MSSSLHFENPSSNQSSTNEGNHNLADVLLYAQAKLTRKQAVQEIADVVLKANMKPRTVKHALDLLKTLLPPENTLPATVDELFGAMLSSENDWRLAQYLIKHKQRPSFVSSSSSANIWSDSSNSLLLTGSGLTPGSSSVQSPSLFLPISGSSSSSSSNSSSSSSGTTSDESESESESESSGSESSDDDDEDERNILLALQEAQQQRLSTSPLIRSSTESAVIETNPTPLTFYSSSIPNLANDTADQRSQIVSSSINRFPFLGAFKRQRSESSSEESDVFFSTRLSNHEDDDDDSDNETPFYPISNNNNNNKSCCFEMNGCDLLDGGKRRRH